MATSKKRRNKKSIKSKTFKMSKNNIPFFTFKITTQTVYWVVLLSVITIAFLQVLNVQIEAIRAVSNL